MLDRPLVDVDALVDRGVQGKKKLAEIKLPADPVFDGMAATNGRIYLSTKGGYVSCFSGE